MSRLLRATEEIASLLPGLSSARAEEAQEADGALERLCFEAGRPGAERERRALALAIARPLLDEDVTVAARALLLRKLALVGKFEVVKTLSTVLSESEHPLLRDGARRALEANPTSPAKSALRRALEQTSDTLQAAICRSLGERRDYLAVGGLVKAYYAKNQDVSLAAAEALAEIGDEQSVAVLESALVKFQGSRSTAARRAYLRLAHRLVENGDRGMARRLYVRAMEMGPSIRAAALIGVAGAGLQSEVPKIVTALDDEDAVVRGAALDAAVLLKGEPMSKALIGKFEQATGRLRRDLLEVVARRDDALTRAAVLQAARSDREAPVRQAAVRALEALNSPDALPVLFEALKAGGDLADAAEGALSRSPVAATGGAVRTAYTESAPTVRARLLRVLAARGDTDAFELIAAAARDEEARVRLEAYRALGRLGDSRGLEVLREAVKRATGEERETVQRALGRIQRRSSSE